MRECALGGTSGESSLIAQGGTGTPAALGPPELPSAASALRGTRFQQQTETLGSRVLEPQFPVILKHKLEIIDSILLKLWISRKKWHRKPVQCSPMFIGSQWFTNKIKSVYKLLKNIPCSHCKLSLEPANQAELLPPCASAPVIKVNGPVVGLSSTCTLFKPATEIQVV